MQKLTIQNLYFSRCDVAAKSMPELFIALNMYNTATVDTFKAFLSS